MLLSKADEEVIKFLQSHFSQASFLVALLVACVAATKQQQSDQLRNWTASFVHKFKADERNGRFKLLAKPEFKCVMCKTEIVASPVFQVLGSPVIARFMCQSIILYMYV